MAPARPPSLLLSLLLLAAALAPAPALGGPPAAAAPQDQAIGKGDVLSVDLSRVPARVERRGTAICAAARITATGAPEEVQCRQPFTLDAPFAGDPIVLLFQPTDGGRPVRLEYPLVRDPRPRAFTAPSAGTVRQLKAAAPKVAAGAAAMPADLVAQAREAAQVACGKCPGATFALRDLTVDEVPPAALEVVITIQPPR